MLPTASNVQVAVLTLTRTWTWTVTIFRPVTQCHNPLHGNVLSMKESWASGCVSQLKVSHGVAVRVQVADALVINVWSRFDDLIWNLPIQVLTRHLLQRLFFHFCFPALFPINKCWNCNNSMYRSVFTNFELNWTSMGKDMPGGQKMGAVQCLGQC